MMLVVVMMVMIEAQQVEIDIFVKGPRDFRDGMMINMIIFKTTSPWKQYFIVIQFNKKRTGLE